jgi:glucose-1-phosphate cytidylyltransferase
VLLCGGKGTRMREETEFRPKPLVEVGGRPLLWHIMKLYGSHGFRDFVLCLGYRGGMIKQYFADYYLHNSDVTFELASGKVDYERGRHEDWRVTLVDTGEDAMTGARVKRVAPHLDGDVFCLSYGDGVADVDLSALMDFHRSHGKLATVTGVRPPARWGRLDTAGTTVRAFAEKPADEPGHVNGGFFVFDRSVLDRLWGADDCVLEGGPLERLAAEGQLEMFAHDGFWQAADTLRDVEQLRALWASGEAPWRVWDDRAPQTPPQLPVVPYANRRTDSLTHRLRKAV